MSKESFKQFIKERPYLAKAVLNNKTSFQKLYEIYDMYGETSPLFTNFNEEIKEVKETSSTSFKEISNFIKNIDLDALQKGVNGLRDAITLISKLTPTNDLDTNSYEERPINKYYED